MDVHYNSGEGYWGCNLKKKFYVNYEAKSNKLLEFLFFFDRKCRFNMYEISGTIQLNYVITYDFLRCTFQKLQIEWVRDSLVISVNCLRVTSLSTCDWGGDQCMDSHGVDKRKRKMDLSGFKYLVISFLKFLWATMHRMENISRGKIYIR